MNSSKRRKVGASFLAMFLMAGAVNIMTTSMDPVIAAIEKPADKFRAAGKQASLTVIPARLAGTPMPKVGEVIALMFEKGGMTNLELSDKVFVPADGADMTTMVKAFAEHVKSNSPATEYVLFADILGSREKGISEVRTVIANRQGEIVWQDRQVPGVNAFDRIKPREPMQCCQLIFEQLRPILSLDDLAHAKADSGKIAERWRKDTGVPDSAAMGRIEQRGKSFKKNAATASVTIYPSHAGESYSTPSAANLSNQINAQKLTRSKALDRGPQFEITRDMNEQKTLWSMANQLSEYVKKNPPEDDYVLFADYLMGKDAVGGVHFAICDKQGELVVVDYQNSHSPDFRAINPKSKDDCDKLVVKRLQTYCR